MNALAQLRGALAHTIRPLSKFLGVGRICRLANRGFLKVGAPPIQVARMRDGTRMRLDLRSQAEWYTFYSGRYDDDAITLICNLMSQTDGDFLDVGGNVGMYAVRVAAGLGDGRRSLCFEPMPENAELICENAC